MRNGSSLILMALIATATPRGAAAQSADLAGVWVLDEAASDTLELEPSDTAQTRSSRFRLGYGYPPRARSIRDPLRMRDAVDAVASPAARIYIAESDSTLAISFDSEPPITLHTDGRKVERSWLAQDNVHVRASRDDRVLRIERKLESQVEIRESWKRDGDTLIIDTVVDGPIPHRLEVRRVYRRAERTGQGEDSGAPLPP